MVAGAPTDPTPAGACTKVEKNVTIRAMADMQSLPRTGCYDIYGSLTLQVTGRRSVT